MKRLALFLFILLSFSAFAQQDLQTARQLYSQAMELKKQNKLNQAASKLQQASTIFKQNNSIKNYIISEYSLADIYLLIGLYPKAYQILDSIKPVAIKQFGQNSDLMVNIFSNIAQSLLYSNKIDSAENYFVRAIHISRSLHGDSTIQIAGLYSNLGILYANMGKYDKALNLFENSLKIQRKLLGENSPNLMQTLNNLSYIYINLGNYDKALEIQQKLITLTAHYFGKTSPQYASSLLAIANIYIAKGQPSLAEEYLNKLTDLYIKLYGSDNIKLVDPYINLGIVYNALKHYDMALQYYSAALNIYKKYLPENNPEVLALLNNIAVVYRKMGNYETAIQYYDKILRLTKQQDTASYKIPIILTNIGGIYYTNQNYDSAVVYYDRAIKYFHRLYGLHNPNLVIPYINLGYVYMKKQDYNAALKMLQYAIIANIKDFDNTDPFSSPSKIITYYNGLKLLETLSNKSVCFIQLYKQTDSTFYLEKAFENFLLADSLIHEQRKIIVSQKDKLILNAHSLKVYENAIYTCKQLASTDKNKRNFYLNQAFYFVERNKASLLAQAINATKATKIAGIPDSLLQKEKLLKERIGYIENKLAKAQNFSVEISPQNIKEENNPEAEYTQEANLRNLLFNYKSQYRQLIKYFEQNYPKYYQVKYSPSIVSIKQIQNMLEPDQALISYFYGYNNLYIYTITKDTSYIGISSTKGLADTIVMFYKSLQSNADQAIQTFRKTGLAIYKYVMPANLPQNIDALIIIPDDLLNIIPFEALLESDSLPQNPRDYKDYPYLIKSYSISYSYSSFLLYTTHVNVNTTLGPIDFLGIAPGFLGDNTPIFLGNRITPIPGTIDEVKSIASIFSQKGMTYKIMLDTNATETAFKRLNLDNYKILHIATHGFIFSKDPELSALIFSKESSPDDGFLYVNEIYNMTINSSLVTLSACETGLGKISKGEGVLGLSRAFIYAGAQNLVLSLWKVADKPTKDLMTAFYSNLLNSNPQITTNTHYSKALQKAKLMMINSKLSHPYYWASFILIGL